MKRYSKYVFKTRFLSPCYCQEATKWSMPSWLQTVSKIYSLNLIWTVIMALLNDQPLININTCTLFNIFIIVFLLTFLSSTSKCKVSFCLHNISTVSTRSSGHYWHPSWTGFFGTDHWNCRNLKRFLDFVHLIRWFRFPK